MKKFMLILSYILLFLQFLCASVGLFLPFEQGLPLICFNVPFIFLWIYNIRLIHDLKD